MDIPARQTDTAIQHRILVVDDDPEVRELLQAVFEKEGFEVWTVPSAERALEVLRQRGLVHLAIIDIHLPGEDGLTLCRKIQEFSDLPIMMLTVVDEEKTVVESIERWAEDYLTKPFSPAELVARVRRLLRRIGDFSYALQPVVRIDETLEVDFFHQRVMVEGRPIALTPTESKLLYILMKQSGHTVPTHVILDRVWPKGGADENTLRVHIHRLRHKIERSPNRPAYIVTERGTGYSFLSGT